MESRNEQSIIEDAYYRCIIRFPEISTTRSYCDKRDTYTSVNDAFILVNNRSRTLILESFKPVVLHATSCGRWPYLSLCSGLIILIVVEENIYLLTDIIVIIAVVLRILIHVCLMPRAAADKVQFYVGLDYAHGNLSSRNKRTERDEFRRLVALSLSEQLMSTLYEALVTS
jgi:hypothetical protein